MCYLTYLETSNGNIGTQNRRSHVCIPILKRPKIGAYLGSTLSLDIFQILSFIAFETCMISANEVHHASFKLFELENILIHTKFFSGMFWNACSISNVMGYILTPPWINFRKLVTLQEHSNVKYSLDQI